MENLSTHEEWLWRSWHVYTVMILPISQWTYDYIIHHENVNANILRTMEHRVQIDMNTRGLESLSRSYCYKGYTWGSDHRNSGPVDFESTGYADIPEVISPIFGCIRGIDIFGCWKNLILVSWLRGPELLKWGRWSGNLWISPPTLLLDKMTYQKHPMGVKIFLLYVDTH